jgi:F-type H+-transporting ATPase subunit b
MEKLLQPDTGLMVWTVITFLLLVAILTKAAWKPILQALNEREGKIKGDLERAEALHKEAEALKAQFESQVAAAKDNIADMMAQAKSDGERTRAQLLSTAREEATQLLEKGRRDLNQETARLKDELRRDVASLSVAVAEKVLSKTIDSKLHEELMQESLQELKGGVK